MTDKFSNVLKAKEDMQKSPEQLEKEKREILSQRIPKLQLSSYKDDMIASIQQFHDQLEKVINQIYDLNEQQDRQKYDMMELVERAKQIEKGKAKTRKSNIVHTGLGGSVFAKLAEEFPSAPPKISLFSRYERVTDRRTFKDRRDLWASNKEKKEFIPIPKVKAKIKKDDYEEEEEPIVRRKQKSVSAQPEEHHEEPAQEEQVQEEEQHEEQQEEEQPQEEEQQEEVDVWGNRDD